VHELAAVLAGGADIDQRALAARLRVPFVELDSLVEKDAGLSLAAIFSLHGEAYYRRLAREVLARFLAATDGAVVATGGGLVTDREAYRLLMKRARTVWLPMYPAPPVTSTRLTPIASAPRRACRHRALRQTR